MRLVFPVALVLVFAAAGCSSKPKAKDAVNSPSASATGEKAMAETKATEKKMDEKAKAMTDKAENASSKVECKNKNDTRILEVRNKDKGCELAYTKNGQEAVVASSSNGNAHCDQSLVKIKDKLAAAGFECK